MLITLLIYSQDTADEAAINNVIWHPVQNV